MRVLLDTHTFLWWISDDPQLSSTAKDIISDSNNQLLLSVVSGWEIAIKVGLKKLQISEEPENFVPEQMTINSISPLPIQMKHALHVYKLPLHHKDPFDRLIIAQAQKENLPIITIDSMISLYQVDIIW